MTRSRDPYKALASIFMTTSESDDAPPADDAAKSTGAPDADDVPLRDGDHIGLVDDDAIDARTRPSVVGTIGPDRDADGSSPGVPEISTTRTEPGSPPVPAKATPEARVDALLGEIDVIIDAAATTAAEPPAIEIACPPPAVPARDTFSQRMSGDAASGAPAEASVAPAPIERVILGHLPVRAGIWLAPFMHVMSMQAGASVLIRRERDEVRLELFGRRGPAGLERLPLRAAVTAMSRLSAAWVLHAAGPPDPHATLAGRPERVTILTSGDPMSVARCRSIAASLVAAAEQRGVELPVLGVAVVGVVRREAEGVAAAIDAAVRADTGRGVELRCCIPRIEPGAVPESVVSGPPSGLSPTEVIERLRAGSEMATAADPAVASAPPNAPEPAVPSAGPDVDFIAAFARDEPDGASPVVPARAPAAEFAAESPRSRSAPDRPAEGAMRPPAERPVPAPTVAEFARFPTTEALAAELSGPPIDDAGGRCIEDPDGSRSLAEHVVGLVGLPVRCPDHPAIELAVDTRGGLHVLADVEDAARLAVVSHWAAHHADLLAMACRDTPIDRDRRPVGHVFTDDPLRIADLRHSGLRLHLRAPIELGGRRGWYVTRLGAAVD